MNAAVKRQILRLVGERVDVSARVLGHHDEAGGAGARLRRSTRVVAMQEVVEAGCVCRVRGRARVAQLLEVVDAGGLERLEQPLRDQSR